MELEPLIGLEIHVQLKTKSKMFCFCDNQGEEKPPNTTICPICLGHPGVLPTINKEAVKFALMAALALGCQINYFSKFDRKNYFYPDLPKGYQISQYDLPLGYRGRLIINYQGKEKVIRIKRVHLEEDAAKLFHSPDQKRSFVDFNRAGTPLMEIVTEAEVLTPQETKEFLQELRRIMRYLEISEADMEKGHLRCDVNISLRPKGEVKFYPKTEIKNLNSFKAVERALIYEIKRQEKLWQKNTPPKEHTTRGWNEEKQITEEQRSKEEASDYRYFPEPDLPPLVFKKEWIEELKADLPELPNYRRFRFVEMYEMDPLDARILTEEKEIAHFTEEVISELKAWLLSLEEAEGTEEEIWQKYKKKLVKMTTNWLVNKFLRLFDENKISFKESKVSPENFAELITLIYQNKINSKVAQEILEEMFKRGSDPCHILEEKNLSQISDEEEIKNIALKIIEAHPQAVNDFKKGKENALQFLVGQIMRETRGKANPELAQKILKKIIEKK